MRGHDRYLQFDNINQGEPVATRCSLCKREFVADSKSTERMDDVILRLRAAFEAHLCDEADCIRLTPKS